MLKNFVCTDDGMTILVKKLVERQESGQKYWLTDLFLKAMIRCELGYIDDGIADMNQALQEFLKSNTLSQSQERGEQNPMEGYEQAIKDFSCMIQLNLDFEENYYLRGQILMVQGRYQEAIDEFTQAICSEDSIFDSYFFRGRCYAKLGESSKAKKDMKHILTNDPHHENAAEFLRDISSN